MQPANLRSPISRTVRGRVWRKPECIHSPVPSFRDSFGQWAKLVLLRRSNKLYRNGTSVRDGIRTPQAHHRKD